MANLGAFDEQRVGDATPEPNPASRVEAGSDSGGKDERKSNPASCVEGGSGSHHWLQPYILKLTHFWTLTQVL